ncbi:ABC transporter permease [Streptomyces sp. 6N223]|uniref:ABC transporter permease n=1 Tax=Streptomyces sp. 6N223 TaxID=3457412 RepID=UPI003FD2E2A0
MATLAASAAAPAAAPASPAATALTEVGAVTARRLRHLRRAPGRAIGVILNPLVSLVMLGYLFRDALTLPAVGEYADYVFAGCAVQVGLSCVGPTAVAMAQDLNGGLVDRFRSLPIGRYAVPFGHSIADWLVGVAALAVTAGAGLLLGWRPQRGLLPTLAAFGLLAVFLYAMLWLGVLFAMTMRSVETIAVVAPFIVIVLPFFSSAFLAPQAMPAPIRPVAEWNPVSAVAASCRELWGNPAPPGGGLPAEHPLPVVALTLTVVFAACVAVSLRRFRTASH